MVNELIEDEGAKMNERGRSGGVCSLFYSCDGGGSGHDGFLTLKDSSKQQRFFFRIILVVIPWSVISFLVALRYSHSEYMPQLAAAKSEQPGLASRHDNSSVTSYMWYRGKAINPLQEEIDAAATALRDLESSQRRGNNNNITIDAISIASKHNLEQLQGQAASWASHPSVRYLFGMTEDDEADPTCSERFPVDWVEDFLRRCAKTQYTNRNSLSFIYSMYPRYKWVQQKKNMVGWLCAQQRFAQALGKVGRFYRKEILRKHQRQQHQPQSTLTTTDTVLPDFLLLQDDDTGYGINSLTSYLMKHNRPKNPSASSLLQPFVTAGCLVRFPIHLVNFSFPIGGLGLMANRVAIERLIQPIYCNRTMEDVFPSMTNTLTNTNTLYDQHQHTKLVCSLLKENLIGERMAFQEGMSISDIMDRHAAMLPFFRYRTWNITRSSPYSGYCMNGDWIYGYYFNYYGLGMPNASGASVLYHDRIDPGMGYHYYENQQDGSCKNQGMQECRQSDTKRVCHYLNPDDMMELHLADQNSSAPQQN